MKKDSSLLVVGIAGGSGSGKTTVADRLQSAIGADCSVVEFDNYYQDRADLSDAEREEINYDHPNALETSLLATHVLNLKNGQEVDIPQYDFINHRRKNQTKRVKPGSVLIVEGILALAVNSIRELMDIKIYVDTDADLRVMRRIRRDLERRGRTFQSVRKQYYEHVRPMHNEFVEPSKKWADVIVPEGGENQVAIELLLARLKQHIRPF